MKVNKTNERHIDDGQIVIISEKHPKYAGRMARIKRALSNGKVCVSVLSNRGGMSYGTVIINSKYLRKVKENGKTKNSMGKKS